MSTTQCFFLEPVAKAQQSLRRFVMSSSGFVCNGPGPRKFHNASVILGLLPVPIEKAIGGTIPNSTERLRVNAWPTKCDACEYVFDPKDKWQVNLNRIYRRTDTGEELTLQSAPIGALWYADWISTKGPDGHCLVCKTPAGDWNIDGPSHNNGQRGPGWTRTGDVPNISATPSIGMGAVDSGGWRYHAYLTNGVLQSCSDSPL